MKATMVKIIMRTIMKYVGDERFEDDILKFMDRKICQTIFCKRSILWGYIHICGIGQNRNRVILETNTAEIFLAPPLFMIFFTQGSHDDLGSSSSSPVHSNIDSQGPLKSACSSPFQLNPVMGAKQVRSNLFWKVMQSM